MSRALVQLAPKGDAAVRARHPWIFSGAVARVSGDPEPGAEVDVIDSTERWVGRGLFNPHSQIRVRVYTSGEEALDGAFFSARVRNAVSLRRDVLQLADPRGACRVVFSEGDGLSGLTVDRYGSYLVVQLTGLGIAARLEAVLDALEEEISPEAVLLRIERGVAKEEGLTLEEGSLRGAPPEKPVEIVEGTLRFVVDLQAGQKTGFYLDQRENRRRVAAYARDRTVADVCSYSGGFSVATACAGAAAVTAVDTSGPALVLARRNAERNGAGDLVETVQANAFDWLTEQAAAGRTYDMVVLDPPRFARSRRGVRSALSAYERLNALAIRCLAPEAVLVTFSCSGRVSESEFQAAVARAFTSCGRHGQILERLAQGPDHPVATNCPQSAYLKGLVCSVR